MKTGIEIIADERQRQLDREGYTPEHDDTHSEGEMLASAISYSLATYKGVAYAQSTYWWPFGSCEFKPSTSIRNLAKAGALIAAEIDRLQRAGESP